MVSQSEPNLPLQIEDAMRRSADEHGGDQQQEEESGKEGGQQLARVKQDTKLGWANSVQLNNVKAHASYPPRIDHVNYLPPPPPPRKKNKLNKNNQLNFLIVNRLIFWCVCGGEGSFLWSNVK